MFVEDVRIELLLKIPNFVCFRHTPHPRNTCFIRFKFPKNMQNADYLLYTAQHFIVCR